MTVLSDSSIRLWAAARNTGVPALIDPYDPTAVQPASVDLRLAHDFKIMDTAKMTYIHPRIADRVRYREVHIARGEEFILHPNELILASTVETVRLPADMVARVEGKSSLGRLGLLIHATAGFIDPGFEGQVTLELSNVAGIPIVLEPQMKIAQISFMMLDRPAVRPYGHPDLNSKYQNQAGPKESRYDLNASLLD